MSRTNYFTLQPIRDATESTFNMNNKSRFDNRMMQNENTMSKIDRYIIKNDLNSTTEFQKRANYIQRLDCMIGMPKRLVQNPGFESLLQIESEKVALKRKKQE
jgi:hypothetical protein